MTKIIVSYAPAFTVVLSINTLCPCVRAPRGREGYRGPPWRATGSEVPRATKKKEPPAAERRARTKMAGKNYFGGSDGA